MIKQITFSICAITCLSTVPALAQTRVEVQYTGDLLSNVQGGIRKKTELISSLDIALDHRFKGIGGNTGTLHIGGMISSGADFSGSIVGDFQTVSSIDGFPSKPYLAEFWYEQSFANETVFVLAGLFDLNSEFDTLEAADLFFNASRAHGTEFAGAGINGTGAYPLTPLAGRIKWNPSDNLELRVAVAEGTPRNPDNLNDIGINIDDGEGALVLVQSDWFSGTGARLSATYWHFTSDFDVINQPGQSSKGNNGGFAVLEMPLAASEDRGLYGYARLGVADTRFNAIESYSGIGLYYKGPFGRENDRAGFGMAISDVSDRYRIEQGLQEREINYEAAYHFQVNDTFGIGASAQYIKNPGAHQNLEDAFVLGLRVSMGQIFEW